MRFSYFLNNFDENVLFSNRKLASRADSIVFYNEFARPGGQENRGQCGQNMKNNDFCIFLC